jgi:RecJ-like exonuclease
MDLTLDDLAEKCAECNGTGKRKEEPEKRGGRTYTSIPLGSMSFSDCQRCQGSGRTKLTEAGRAIRDMLAALKKNSFLQ